MKKLSHTKTHPVAFALMGLLLVLCSTAEKVELKINQIQEILSVFPVSKLITPDQVKGEFAALREAITTRGWPSVSSAKGKIIFILDAGPEITDQYVKSASTGKPLFVNVPEDHSDAGFFIMNDPVRQQEDIARKVKAGFMVRTRSDADTKEARSGDYTRLNAATASGAQLISTDYYLSSLSPSGKFQITLNGKYQRCNPVTAPQDCDCKFFDDSVHDGIL